ncbi:uncharacterized protein NECHADRAFT_40348 [Fusarium vanettenii 77-13-4]|uniref:Peptidase A1 domain-containing protein n=1 Tax=Fusarium vanettenii (strain ATCC MYA-4622 / CBS 123669 / FGSC 9596 / NRRL 45880 / 77-13-4) TaxID=660122 RepID=C7Z0Z9_FUSV7|nr:uncharacterized protein NECHADRAFT_40348 [Fusarium vanettenii 77-13-4]EEU42284.1 hypothetical protein NECHADRAFT_40348 [Fusarium vanettenii 77-13-4]
MRSPVLLVTLLATSFATALVVPAGKAPVGKVPVGFSLEASTRSGSKPSFVRALVAAKEKWGDGVPRQILEDFSLLDDDGQVNVEPMENDAIYIADVKIGNPPQTVKIAIDTGSADLYEAHSHPNMSRTSRRLRDAMWDVSYVDGTHAHGSVYLDTVRIGDFELKDAAIQSAHIVAMRFETHTEITGIMGLAKNLSSNVSPQTPSLLDTLRPHLESPVFTADLRRNATGRFDFGRIDESRIKDNITWVNTREDSPHWDVAFDMTAWNGQRRVWFAHTFEATVDTGTSLLFMPPSLAALYWYDVPGMRIDPRLDNSFTFPCQFAEGLPDLMFKIPGTEHILTIPGSYLNYGPVKDDPEYCWGGMQSADAIGGVTIFGDVVLKALYVAFDLENNKVGFANKHLDDVDE